MQQPVYLDHQASTPIDPRVKAEMCRYEGLYGNPHTTSHIAGIEAGRAVDEARRRVARAIGGDARGVVFTSGATEANNLAIFGVARAATSRRKVVTVGVEHSSVLEPALALRDEGFQVEVLPVGGDGIVDLDAVAQAVDENTLLASVMHVNNETGVVQPIADIAEICHRSGALLHSDCAQSLGKVPFTVERLGADLLTLSGHKCYGPKGIGALYVHRRREIALRPLYLGGDQEGGLRPGTLPVPLCIGFGEACRLAAAEVQEDATRVGRLAHDLLAAILDACPTARLNGSIQHRAPGAFNVRFPDVAGDELLGAFEGLQVSSGSACTSTALEPSRVLLAYGLSADQADASLRFCLGRFTTEDDVCVARRIVQIGVVGLRLA